MTNPNTPATTQAGGDLVGTEADRGVRKTGELSSAYTGRELDALRALGGLDEASDGDLDMLAAVSEQTGLNPFIKEVYLIGRKTKVGGYRGEPERWETKWTVQAGIDGFRKVTRRYADSRDESVEIGRPVFYDDDGNPRPFWRKAWGYPAAAEVTVRIGDSTSHGVAVWDEYVQTKRDGKPNQMWENMRSTMLAKCAEAQAHRKACSLTAGMYEPAEIREPVTATATRADVAPGAGASGAIGSLKERLAVESAPAAAAAATAAPVEEPEPVPADLSFDDADVAKAADANALAEDLVARAAAAASVEDLRATFNDAAGHFAEGSPHYEAVRGACNDKLAAEGWEL